MDITATIENNGLNVGIYRDSPLNLVLEPADVPGEGQAETGESRSALLDTGGEIC